MHFMEKMLPYSESSQKNDLDTIVNYIIIIIDKVVVIWKYNNFVY